MSRSALYQWYTNVKICIVTRDQQQVVHNMVKRIGERRGATIKCLQWGHHVFSAAWDTAEGWADLKTSFMCSP